MIAKTSAIYIYIWTVKTNMNLYQSNKQRDVRRRREVWENHSRLASSELWFHLVPTTMPYLSHLNHLSRSHAQFKPQQVVLPYGLNWYGRIRLECVNEPLSRCTVWVCMYVLNYLFDLGHLRCYFKSNVNSGITAVTLKAIVLQPLINPTERRTCMCQMFCF